MSNNIFTVFMKSMLHFGLLMHLLKLIFTATTPYRHRECLAVCPWTSKFRWTSLLIPSPLPPHSCGRGPTGAAIQPRRTQRRPVAGRDGPVARRRWKSAGLRSSVHLPVRGVTARPGALLRAHERPVLWRCLWAVQGTLCCQVSYNY